MSSSFGGVCITLTAAADLRDKEGYFIAWDGGLVADSDEAVAGVLVKGGNTGEQVTVQINGLARAVFANGDQPLYGEAIVITAGVATATAIASVSADKYIGGYVAENFGAAVSTGQLVKVQIAPQNVFTA